MDFGRLLADPIMHGAVVKKKKIDVRFFERLENSEKVREVWSSLGGPHFATKWQRVLGFYS